MTDLTPTPPHVAPVETAAEAPAIGSSPHIDFTPDNQPKPVAPTQTPADRAKAAIAAMNASIGADLHDRLHAQHNALNAMFNALFP
jgi:hypothetical protein